MKPSKVSDLLDKINRLAENPDFPAISKLERDLLMQYIRNFYEEVDVATLKRTTETVSPEIKVSGIEQKTDFQRPSIQSNDHLLIKEESKPSPVIEPIKKTETKVTVEEKIASKVTEPKSEVIVEKVVLNASSSINDSIKSGGSLNEKLKTSSAAEIHKKLASKPLKELIDLNKKFVLLNELFKGNAEAYSAAIGHIDTLPDYDSAQSFITSQLITNYAWDEGKQSTRMFTKLVKLKFGVE